MAKEEAHLQTASERFEKLPRFGCAVAVVLAVLAEQALVLPNRNPILTPITAQGPAGQFLARIPLALPSVQ